MLIIANYINEIYKSVGIILIIRTIGQKMIPMSENISDENLKPENSGWKHCGDKNAGTTFVLWIFW